MRHPITPAGIAQGMTAALVLVAGSACAHVSQEDLDGRLDDLRGDLATRMDEGDRQVRGDLEGRIDGVASRVDALRSDLEALEEEFGVTVQELEAALRFDVPVYFGFDQAEVAQRGREALQRFSRIAGEHYPEATITVEGFTDPAGSAEYNRRLGMRRAEAVKGHLVEAGLPDDRIRTVSYGEDTSRLIEPDATGPGNAGWENRRVVLVIDHVGDLAPTATVTEAGSD